MLCYSNDIKIILLMLFNKSQSTGQFRLPLASTTSRSNFNTKILSPKFTQSFRPKENIELIEIKNNFPQRELFFELQRLWDENQIPEIHQKYYYFILTSNIASQEYLMRSEIESYKLNGSIIKTLHQLTISREICLKEALAIEQSENIIEFVCLISNYIYDLRKITLNLIEYQRKWVNKLYIQYAYNYQWIYQGENYVMKIKDDHKLLFQKHPVLMKFFHISESVDDIFYLGIINQAYERDLEYFDYLTKHKLDQKYLKRIKELQTYATVQYTCKQSENKIKTLLQTKTNFLSTKELQSAQQTSRKGSTTKLQIELPPLPEYRSQLIYKSDDIQFIIKDWPIKDIPQILSFWLSTNFEDFHKSFLQPSTYIQETLSYGQEAIMLQISDLGIMLASVEQDCNIRKWVIHLIVCKEQIFDKIIHHFIRMLISNGDSFEQLGINLTLLECFEYNLKILNFYFCKIITIENLKVNYTQYVLDIKRTEQEQQSMSIIYDPICFIYARIISRIKKLVLNSDEETMEAQFCANLGKSNLIVFDEKTQEIAKNLIKQKIYGSSFQHIQNIKDVTKVCARFKSPIKTPVYLQYFNMNLQFMVFSSEIHKQTHQPYIRFPSRSKASLDEASLLQLSSNEGNSLRKVYLISTTDPFVKIYVFELKNDEVTLDIPTVVNDIFEKYDQKSLSQYNIWLPFFRSIGNRQNLTNCKLLSYFTSEAFFEINFPRIGMNSVNYSFEGEKLINFPFIVGIVQSDLDQINKPIFSMLVQQEDIIKKCEPIQIAKKMERDYEILVMQINPKDIELRVKEMVRFSCPITQDSFEKDPQKLIDIMYYQQEACVLQFFVENLVQGYSIMYVDQNKIHERVWIIEMVSCKSECFFDIFLTQIVDLVFGQDTSASEILIAQNHYPQNNGQIMANKYISEAIKKVGFKWRIVENDYKTQLRRTIFTIKRSNCYQPKAEHNISIKFNSYYSLQQSEARNEETNTLCYLKTKPVFQFAEDCFHYNLHKPYEQNQFIIDKVKNNLASLPMTQFAEFKNEEEVHKYFEKLTSFPSIDPRHTQVMAQYTNVQLKWLRSREIVIEGSKYIEVPNEQNFIYVSTFPKMNRRIYYVKLFNPGYYFFAMEVAYNQIDAIRNDYVRFTDRINQEFYNKQPQTSSDLYIPQFQTCLTISEPNPNWSFINFSLIYNHTITQNIIKDLGNRTIRMQMPILAGIIQEDISLRYEKPIVAFVASEYID
ncbi:unnamed protein product [Paramecium octaurelia]|uniref:Uncharacterized protein n=1 Tax=Paramecium octaurelia TaxID=43137 RepID=A0A8S1X720_PAROT|nr:unnamed protein product [Paramecium octaurelia]